MIISKKQSVEDLIVEILAKTPYLSGVLLVGQVQKLRSATKKQTVYAALKDLISSEIVSKVGGEYFLSRVWLNKITKLFGTSPELSSDAIFALEEGESISYSFPSLLTCDTYWAHVFDLLVEWIPNTCPIFVWNPHEWFAIARKSIELEIFKQFPLKQKHAFYAVQGKNSLDQLFKRDWTSEHVSIATDNTLPYPNNYYLNIFDNIIIEVFLEPELAQGIADFYTTHSEITPQALQAFDVLLNKKYRVRMKISRKPKQAALIRKRLAKDFFIPKHLLL